MITGFAVVSTSADTPAICARNLPVVELYHSDPSPGVAISPALGFSTMPLTAVTRAVLAVTRKASLKLDPLVLTLIVKSSLPTVPNSMRPEAAVWNSRLAVSATAFLLTLT